MENPANLTRRELQALCKRHGIKANMKNVEMINALQEKFNSTRSPTVVYTCSTSTAVSSVSLDSAMSTNDGSLTEDNAQMLPHVVLAQEPVQKSLDPVKTSSEPVQISSEPVKTSSESVQISLDPIKTSSEPVQISSEPIKTSSEPVKTSSEPVQISLEPVKTSSDPLKTSSEPVQISSEPMQIFSPKTSSEPMQICLDSEQMSSEPEQIFSELEPAVTSFTIDPSEKIDLSPIKGAGDDYEAPDKDIVASKNVQPLNDGSPLQLPAANISENEASDVQNTTFVIESPEKDVPNPLVELSDSLRRNSQHIDSPLSGVWALRDQLGNSNAITPVGSMLDQQPMLACSSVKESIVMEDSPLLKSIVTGDKENKTTTDIRDDIMKILDDRVEKRMNAPDYVPEPVSDTPVISRSTGVKKSEIARKFDRAHKKEFRKMTSISEVAAARQRRKRPINEIDTTSETEKSQKKSKVELQSQTPRFSRIPRYSSKKISSAHHIKSRPLTSSVTKDKRPPFRL